MAERRTGRTDEWADERDQGVSRRRLLRWGSLGAASLGTAALAACSGPSHATPNSASDSFSSGATAEPSISPLPGGASASPATLRSKPIFKVHDLFPNAPADTVALTIDDGPNPTYTPQVLALLKQYDIQATFSVVGIEAHAHPDLIRRIAADGHTLSNHTMHHPQPLSRKTEAQIRQEIEDTQSVIVDAGAPAPTLFRSPGGDWSSTIFSVAAQNGLTPIDWDIDPRDWARPGTAKITEKLLAAKPGDILLCHDGGGDRSETIASLRTVLPALKAKGYSFITL
ncbi:polysaccharide deacetylase family protein [Kitasatospora sp. NPDC052896]|uniref:polysaccharide deacetylase family protein n=1 Tax=Kitasatospora sp. NPDC052896 TaxID=3364061 RepID=UPI0037CBE2CC